MINRSFLLGVAATLGVLALVAGAYILGRGGGAIGDQEPAVVVPSPTVQQAAADSVPSPSPTRLLQPTSQPVAPSIQPTPTTGPSLQSSEAQAIALGYMSQQLNADPYHPGGTMTCQQPNFHADTRLWFVQCQFVATSGATYLTKLVVVNDLTATAR